MFGVHLIGFFGAARLTSVAVVLLIYALAPVLIIPIAALLLHERPTRTVVVLGIVAIIGVALVVTTGAPQGSNPTLGLIVSIGNLLLWVVWSLVIKGARVRRVDTATWMLCANVGAFVVVLTVALVLGEDLGAINGTDWLLVVALAVGPGLVGHGLNTWALGHVDVGLASVIGLGEPVLAALGAAIFLSEPLGALQLTGIVIVIAAVAIVVARSTRAVPVPIVVRLRNARLHRTVPLSVGTTRPGRVLCHRQWEPRARGRVNAEANERAATVEFARGESLSCEAAAASARCSITMGPTARSDTVGENVPRRGSHARWDRRR